MRSIGLSLAMFGSILLGSSCNGTINGQIADVGRWVSAGDPHVKYGRHKAPLIALPDGRVLVPGGAGSQAQAVEIYDPKTWAWTRLADMARTRSFHTGTLLDDGTVLVVGGGSLIGVPTPEISIESLKTRKAVVPSAASAEAELYHPDRNVWVRVGGSMSQSRRGHIAVKLPSGEVLIAGGRGDSTALRTAEIFNPTTQKWRQVASMSQARYLASAVSLANGRVLVIGGASDVGDGSGDDWTVMSGTYTAEMYNPIQDQWTMVGQMAKPRWNGSATLLSDGRVLAVGMTDTIDTSVSTREGTSEIYDPSTGRWSELATMAGKVDVSMAAVRLRNGNVLVAGGAWMAPLGEGPRAFPQIYDVATGHWEDVAQTKNRHEYPEALLLEDGSVLLMGGKPERYFESSSESTETPSDTTEPGPSVTTTEIASVTPSPEPTETRFATATGSSTRTATITRTSIPRTATPTPAEEQLGYWRVVAPPLNRRYAGDALLMHDGRVLVAGGYQTDESTPNQKRIYPESEIYNPATDSWASAGQMNVPRTLNHLAYLSTGEIITYGGNGAIERFDPEDNSWHVIHSISLPSNQSLSDYVFPAVLTANDRLLLTGIREPTQGCDNRARERTYFLDLHSFEMQPGPALSVGRSQLLSHRFSNGDMLVAGGVHLRDKLDARGFCLPAPSVQVETELIDPVQNSIRRVGDLIGQRFQPTSQLVAFPDGRLVVVGTLAESNNIDIYDPKTETWSSAKGVHWDGSNASVGIIDNRMMMMAGPLRAYLYDLDRDRWYVTGEMADSHQDAAHVTLADGTFMVISGVNGRDSESPLAEIFVYEPPAPHKGYIPLLQSMGIRR